MLIQPAISTLHSINLEIVVNHNQNSGLSSFFISRPVLTWVLNIAISLVGLFVLKNLQLRENPRVEEPQITVSMEYPGASTEVVEQQIANLIEEELSSLEGLKNMKTTISKAGTTDISMRFSGTKSVDYIANEVETKLRKLKHSFPPNLKDPIVKKASQDESSALTLSITGGDYSSSELSDIAYRYAKSELESTSGVASTKISGIFGEGRTYRIDVWLDPSELFAFNTTALDVYNAIGRQSFLYPAGNIEINNIRYSTTIVNDLKNVEDFENVVIKEKDRQVVKVKDVARVEMQNSDEEVRTRYNMEVASFVDVIAQPQANKIEISKNIRQKIEAINKGLPSGVKIEVILDQSEPIKQSLNRVTQSIIEAVIFVVFVMLLFLKSWRASLIPLVAIPICLLSGVITIYAFGFSLNTITLLAMVLGVGLVVDDAIVAVEVIERRIRRGESAFQASINGMNDIQFSIIAMTLTLVAVYAPISLSTGLVGKVFKEFALSLSAMVLMSGIVALTLTPVMSSFLLSNDTHLQWNIINSFESFIVYIERKYKQILVKAISYSKYVLGFSLLIGLCSILMTKYGIQSLLTPVQDTGLISIRLNTVSGANVNYMEYTIAKAEQLIKNTDGVKSVYSSFSSGSGMVSMVAILKPFAQRKHAKTIERNIKNRFGMMMPGTQAFVHAISSSLGGGEQSLSLLVKSNKSYDELEKVALNAISLVQKHEALESSIPYTKISKEKTFEIDIKKDKALSLGVDLYNLKDNIAMIMRGNPPAVRYERNGKRYPVSVWADEKFRQDPDGIKKFHVYSGITDEADKTSRKLISLAELINVTETSSRPIITHDSGMRSIEISPVLKPGYDTLGTYQDLENRLYREFPSGYIVSPGIGVKTLIEEGNNFIVILFLSLIFIFLILAAQFESFYDPIIIMISVPLALSGAIFTIFAVPGLTLNIYTQIGLITLIGLITKHAVLILDYYKKALARGISAIEAAIEASVLRLKPILMTTLAMVLGAVPLILAGGFGSEVRREIGWVIVGGLLFGTLFTLFVIPASCIMFSDLRSRFMNSRINGDER
ncbi:MAG: efflux RND transporter permease subunit [Alphaproteobacteria bacterium]|nr:MAG: efflux RND transporter permease subunit [Alphaproteobacteria bacterium]